MALLAEGNKDRENQLAGSEDKVGGYLLKIDILESVVGEKDRTIGLQNDRVQALERRVYELENKLSALNAELLETQTSSAKAVGSLKSRVVESESMKEELHKRVKKLAS